MSATVVLLKPSRRNSISAVSTMRARVSSGRALAELETGGFMGLGFVDVLMSDDFNNSSVNRSQGAFLAPPPSRPPSEAVPGRWLWPRHPIRPMFPPERIVCLTEETVETLYLLGADRRIVGVSGYAVRPPRVRREKPRVSAFITADVDKILALEPDLVLTFSDLQADIVAALIRRNVAVHAFNQRDLAGILAMIRTLGALVGTPAVADALGRAYEERLTAVRQRAARGRRPRVYFEEWDDPMISSIRWVAELIEIAGGDEVFPELSRRKNAKDRIVSARDVIAAAPDIIVGSWCGKRFVPVKVAARDGFADGPAVRTGWLREIKSPLILQPGPAALTDGLDALVAIVDGWRQDVAGAER